MRSLEHPQTGRAQEPLVRQFHLTGKASQRVPEDNPIKALKYHVQDSSAGASTLKGETVSVCYGWNGKVEMTQSCRCKGLETQPRCITDCTDKASWSIVHIP